MVIQGYWDEDAGGSTYVVDGKEVERKTKSYKDPKCGVSIACVIGTGSHPHTGNKQPLWIEDPPHWGNYEDAREWTTDFDESLDFPDDFQYLPAILMHEFGHTIGLGHGTTWKEIMNGRIRELEPCSYAGSQRERCGLSTNDKDGAKAIYEYHATH